MKTTTQIGDELRDHVLMLLEAGGNRVTREPRVDTKRIDILLELDDDFYTRRIAIECKNLSTTLGQGDLASIYADHLSLIESKHITEVWVIARGSISPEGRNWANSRANFHVFTLAEFEERREGFRAYVRQVAGVFKENALDAYYVPQHLVDGSSLSEKVLAWIASSDTRPLALLGGYGMGKTSFCHYLVAELGRAYLADPTARVPIYVRLSDIAKEQDLDGLIAKTLAQRYSVKNYHFHKFQRLNRSGKFVVIFDGFDEMKHALTWSEFKYNFSQINRVVEGTAKVIIAGRPNAFLSDDEHNWALRGIRVSDERSLRLPGVAEYIELEIRPFSEADARLFLERFLRYHAVQSSGRIDLSSEDEAWIAQRLQEFGSLQRRAELLRPVHLRIFAEIAADRTIELRDFSVHELYSIATSRIAEREAEKPQRTRVDSAARQTVVEEIAWWIWEETEGRSLAFNPARVPTSLIRKAFPQGADLTDEAMSREVFSGSFIERKHGDNFYFAHRSFLEFFVAKKLARARENGLSLTVINSALNPEILSFMFDSGRMSGFVNYVLELMQRFAGELEFSLLKVVRDHSLERGSDLSSAQASVRLILDYLFIYEDAKSSELAHGLIEQFRADLASGLQERVEGALFFVADYLRSHPREDALRPLAAALASYCATQVKWSYWRSRSGEEATMPKLSFSRQNLPEWIFLRSVRLAAELESTGSPVVILDLDTLFNDLFTVRKPRIVVAGREPATGAQRATLRLPFSIVMKGVPARDHQLIVEVLRTGINARVGV